MPKPPPGASADVLRRREAWIGIPHDFQAYAAVFQSLSALRITELRSNQPGAGTWSFLQNLFARGIPDEALVELQKRVHRRHPSGRLLSSGVHQCSYGISKCSDRQEKRNAMSRFTISRKLRLAVLWSAAFALLLGFRYEMDYRGRVSSLPALVDAQRNAASVDVAMAGLDSYDHARRIRTYGVMSLGVGALLCLAAVASKHQSERAHGR
jgi:hypothetical protein